MEEELTCPVCLELYADPLMLPCSHSICKKCLYDILDSRIKTKKEGLECPACRKMLLVSKDKILKLPKNLALENIVFRFQEVQSQTLTKSKSLDIQSEPCEMKSTTSEKCDSPVFPEEISEDCSLCEGKSSRALWFCEQCNVLYCQKCLDSYHPKRGSLNHHKLRAPSQCDGAQKPVFCEDHETEISSIFCDQCKALVCHLCVCDGIGQHAGHKILEQNMAWKQIKETVEDTKLKLESVLSTLSEQTGKLEDVSEEIEILHQQACQKIDSQCQRLIDDTTAMLRQHKQGLISHLTQVKVASIGKLRARLDTSLQQSKSMENMLESCKKMLDEDHVNGLLSRAITINPIVQQTLKFSENLESCQLEFEDLTKEKRAQEEMKKSVPQFRHSAHSCFKLITGENAENLQSIIPHIKSPTSPGKGVPRVHKKSLTTWGFTSTTFTAELVTSNSLWSVTVEKNSSHIGDMKNGYLFGIGISSNTPNVKDLVGMKEKSYGIVCSGGNLCFCHDGKMEQLMPLDLLPISVTVHMTFSQSEGVVFAYTFTSASWGDLLHGRKILTDLSLKDGAYPVFTVSQRVKMQFPTFV